MVTTYILLLIAVVLTKADDLDIGDQGGAKFYDKVVHSKASLWRQYINVTVETKENISRIVVIDTSPDSSGKAKLISGGIGQTKATVELQNMKPLNGLSFRIKVFGLPKPITKKPTTKIKLTTTSTTNILATIVTTTTERVTSTTERVTKPFSPLFRFYRPIEPKRSKLGLENIYFFNPTEKPKKIKNHENVKRQKVASKRRKKKIKVKNDSTTEGVTLVNEEKAYNNLFKKAEEENNTVKESKKAEKSVVKVVPL